MNFRNRSRSNFGFSIDKNLIPRHVEGLVLTGVSELVHRTEILIASIMRGTQGSNVEKPGIHSKIDPRKV